MLMKKQTIEKLTGLAAISTAMGSSADAALVASTTIPTGGLSSPSTNATINWDIDNDGTDEFRFRFSVITSYTSYYTYLFFEDLGNGRAAYQDGGNYREVQKLTAGAKLGTASDSLNFNIPAVQNRILASAYSGTSLTVGNGFRNAGWSLGDTGYFGFKFIKDGNTHYGWAEMTISNSTTQATINEAWYNNTPDEAVTVGSTAVPEPAEVGLGLGALALGAAGLRRMRQKRKAA